MTTPPVYQVRELDTAEQLFEAMSPIHGELWNGVGANDASEPWFFRGQSNSADGTIWKLNPSAFRPNAFLKYEVAQVTQAPAEDGDEQRGREFRAVMSFANRVDKEGLVLPGDSHELRDVRLPRPSRVFSHFPAAQWTAVFALAQHHGVPTRLLDWTWKALAAIYFAAESVAKRRGPGVTPPQGEAPFSVFALRQRVFDAAHDLSPQIVRVHVPTATNANLHAQGGLFTLIQPRGLDEYPLPDLATVLERHADAMLEKQPKLAKRFPMLVEYRVPAREARTTLMYLERMGVTASTIYPGLTSVVRALEEPRYYQWAPIGQRS